MGNAQVVSKTKPKDAVSGERSGSNAVQTAVCDSNKFGGAVAINGSDIQLSDHQKQLIEESWKCLEKDISEVGIIVFINLFETYPDMQSAFLPFTGLVLQELSQSKLLREHALRVMGAVQRTVFRLREPDKLNAFLRELGRRHNYNGAKIDYIDYIGPQFVSAIRSSLSSKWTPELEQAWTLLLAKIGGSMKEAIMEARQQDKEIASVAPTSVPGSNNGDDT